MLVFRVPMMIGYVLCGSVVWLFFLFKQKTAFEVRISDWSSDVCSSYLAKFLPNLAHLLQMPSGFRAGLMQVVERGARQFKLARRLQADGAVLAGKRDDLDRKSVV